MKKTVIVIGAVSQNGVYGEGDKIPWHLPEDFAHFKKQTTGQTVVMGRGTWESLPSNVRPLPGRDNSVITNTPNYSTEGAKIFASIEQAIEMATTEKVFCIGGVSVWYHAMHLAHEAFISVVRKDCVITKETHFARDLLNVKEMWTDFKLQSSTPFNDFDLLHWVK